MQDKHQDSIKQSNRNIPTCTQDGAAFHDMNWQQCKPASSSDGLDFRDVNI